MDMFLLTTKLRIPSPPHRAVQRDRLLDTLERFVNIMLNSGEVRIVERWLESLPEEWHST